jgi:hypothetical protein
MTIEKSTNRCSCIGNCGGDGRREEARRQTEYNKSTSTRGHSEATREATATKPPTLLSGREVGMSEQGWREFLTAEGVDDWVVLHGGATAVFRVRRSAKRRDLPRRSRTSPASRVRALC